LPATIAPVSRSSAKRTSKRRPGARLRAIPWAALLQVVVAVNDRWRSLPPKDRARMTRLIRESRGRLGNLSPKDREELRKLVRKLDLRGLGRDVIAPLRGGGRRKRGR